MGKGTSRRESAAADAHLNDMGRDEMNLAEFPLATLADRAPAGARRWSSRTASGTRASVGRDAAVDHRSVRQVSVCPRRLDDEVILGFGAGDEGDRIR